MHAINASGLGKAFKRYDTQWSRMLGWIAPTATNKYEANWVLKDINFEIEHGEAVGLVGLNGAGKSTLLKLVTGITKPTCGSIKINGSVSALLELGIGFHYEFSGRQNAIMSGQLLGLSEVSVKNLLPEIIEFAELSDYIDEPLRTYSSGMQIRLAFAMATAIRPDILIVDEALSVGDAHFQRKSFKRIQNFQREGTTLLFVSHDQSTVRALCDRVMWLENGKVAMFGETKKVVDSYAASVYGLEQNIDNAKLSASKTVLAKKTSAPKRDCRLDFVNHTNLRNDIKIENFDTDQVRWGEGSSKIIQVDFLDNKGEPLSWAIGGEEIELSITAEVHADIENIGVGFQIRNKYGQVLFGDNTYISTYERPISAHKGQFFTATFHFFMPILPKGQYSITVATTSGHQNNHVVHDWADDCVFFESQNGIAVSGLIGVPMINIDIKKQNTLDK